MLLTNLEVMDTFFTFFFITSIRKSCMEPVLQHMFENITGGGPKVVVCTTAFHARVQGSVPGLGGLKEANNVSSPSTRKTQYFGEPP